MAAWSPVLSNITGRLKGALALSGGGRPGGIFAPSEKQIGSAVEGEYRPGPWQTDEGWFPSTWGGFGNYWQLGYNPLGTEGSNATVESCVKAYAETIAMMPAQHLRKKDNGGTEVITNSDLARFLLAPNSYQTLSDFMFNLIRNYYYTGNAYAVAIRQGRNEISSMHLLPPRSTKPMIAPDGSVFYSVGGNPLLDNLIDPTRGYMIPARDVLHIRVATRNGNPLEGMTPIQAAGMAEAAQRSISEGYNAFFANMSRPSGVLKTPEKLNADQIKILRDRWAEHASGMNTGRVPILAQGLEWQPLAMSAVDSQVIEQLKWTSNEIAKVLRVPPAVVNDMTGSTYSNVETLMGFWLSSGLGFMVNHIELALDRFFEIGARNNTVFDVDALLRPQFQTRIEGLTKAIQGGLMTVNEARAKEDLPKVADGDKIRLQQQMVPIDFDPTQSAIDIAAAAPKPVVAPPAAANEDKPADKPAAAAPTKAEISYRIRAARDARLSA